ncbi:MAG: M18 family aminopeptidase [Spirochaetes bacterium]|nr:M18 family aminopeptidase [Spirochaetota bacterium]
MHNPSVRSLCDFIDASPTQFHAADSIMAALRASGAGQLDDREKWDLEPGKVYFLARNGSSVIAFRTGRKDPPSSGFLVAAAHTDAPGLRVRAEKTVTKRNALTVPVEIYGGPLVSTWLDRPLSLAGRIAYRDGGGEPVTGLVNLAKPVAVVPNLAVHLNRDFNKGFEYNTQTHLPALTGSPDPRESGDTGGIPWGVAVAAASIGVDPQAVLGAELYLVDIQRSTVMGDELVNAPRLDDLAGCHAVLSAFVAAGTADHTQVAAFFDNEEIGSGTAQGAGGLYLRDLLARICTAMDPSADAFYRAAARSFLVSVDAAHAFHPNYADKYDDQYSPVLNGGPVVKANAAFRYATDAVTEAAFRLWCAAAGVPCQSFRTRADMTPGSTIGPMSSTFTGIRTVDVGSPILSMHSIRETAGAMDHGMMANALGAAYGEGPGR